MVISTIELFAGVGMLGEGLRAGFRYLGFKNRAVCYVEREGYAAAVLAARMEEESMDAAPIWSDVCTFDAAAWRGRVDCIVAGFPCQDLSIAGRRAGLDGSRSGLFFEVLRIAEDSGAWLMFLENVSGIATASAAVVDEAEGALDERAAARVVGELADRGWDAEWITLSAADVGASHGRARWFCVAWRSVADTGRGATRRGEHFAGASWIEAEHHAGDETMADSARNRRDRSHGEVGCGRGVCEAGIAVALTNGTRRAASGSGHIFDAGCESESGRSALAVPEGNGREQGRSESTGQQGRHDVAERNGELANADRAGLGASGKFECWPRDPASSSHGLFAPGPSDEGWGDILARNPWYRPALSIEEQNDASAAFSEAQSVLWGMADGLASGLDFSDRTPRLKCVGNGVVALCAATAFVVLARRAGIFQP